MSAAVAPAPPRELDEVTAGPDLDVLALDVPAARRSALVRVVGVALATCAALPWSLATLGSDFRYASALGELVLLPVCALALALVAAWRHPWIAALRPGRADWAVAGGAAAGAAALVTVAPLLAGNVYYAVRPDLLAVPLVAVAALCLLCGVRSLVAMVLPLGMAALAWPLPLRALLEPAAEVLTGATAGAVRLVLQVLPLATQVSGAGDLRLTVAAPGGSFDVVVASACSGMTGIAGMLLVGLAAQYVLHGPARSRAWWLTAAVVGAWVLNVVRILLLLAVGRLLGERAALDVVHPVAGLLLLNLAFAALLVLAPAFGLRFSLARPVPADTPLTDPAPVAERMHRHSLARRIAAVVVGAVVLGGLNTVVPGTTGAYDAAEPAARSFSDVPDAPGGYRLASVESHSWARTYYGAASSWTRYRLAATTSTGPTVWLDSISTDDWAALRAHPLLDCYRFHDFSLERTFRPVLAAGVLADEVVFRRPDGATWHVLSWEWPVQGDGGTLRHERMVLLASSSRTDLAVPPEAGGPGGGAGDRAAATGVGLRALLAQGWGGSDGRDPNPSLTAALRGAADELIRTRLAAGRAG